MPEGSKVDNVYEALKEEGKSESSAAKIAQSVTHEALATGKPPQHEHADEHHTVPHHTEHIDHKAVEEHKQHPHHTNQQHDHHTIHQGEHHGNHPWTHR